MCVQTTVNSFSKARLRAKANHQAQGKRCSCTGSRVSESPHKYSDSKAEKYLPTEQCKEQNGLHLSLPGSLHRTSTMVDYQHVPEDYHFFTVIGRSHNESSNIYLARHVPSGTYVAVERINLEQTEIDLDSLQHEIRMHRALSHPNVVPMFCSFVHDNEIWCVLPLMAYGSCKDVLQAHFTDGLPEQAIAVILRDVLQALEYIHQRGIIHRSVRASHILMSGTGQVCLSGLRYSYSMLREGKRWKRVHDFPDNFLTSLLWASPELLEQNLSGYDTKSDIYSLGITACELANGCAPFADMAATQMLLEKLEGTTPRLLDSVTVPEMQRQDTNAGNGIQENSAGGEDGGSLEVPYQNRTFSKHFHNFVDQCLQAEPKHRPNATTLLQHPFFKQVKRMSSVDSLPDLLQPVSPLTNINLPQDDTNVECVTDKLSKVELQGDWWNF